MNAVLSIIRTRGIYGKRSRSPSAREGLLGGNFNIEETVDIQYVYKVALQYENIFIVFTML